MPFLVLVWSTTRSTAYYCCVSPWIGENGLHCLLFTSYKRLYFFLLCSHEAPLLYVLWTPCFCICPAKCCHTSSARWWCGTEPVVMVWASYIPPWEDVQQWRLDSGRHLMNMESLSANSDWRDTRLPQFALLFSCVRLRFVFATFLSCVALCRGQSRWYDAGLDCDKSNTVGVHIMAGSVGFQAMTRQNGRSFSAWWTFPLCAYVGVSTNFSRSFRCSAK